MTVFQDRWYQEECVDALFDYYSAERKLINGIPERKNALICLPTGTGKSLVIARFLKRAFDMVPNTRAVMATHVKELIKQNKSQLLDVWNTAPVGLYSAGLKRSDTLAPIIFGGIKSMAGKFPIFGFRDFLIIDEAHLLADEGRYMRFIEELLAKNPFLKIIGLTATPYRMGLGLMTNGNIFTDIIYNLCNIDGFSRLIAEGYLCLVISKPTDTKLNVSGVDMLQGDYNQKQLGEAVDKSDINSRVISEYLYYAASRRCGCVFASSIEHAEHLGEVINSFGEDCVVLHSKQSETYNDEAMKAWKNGEVKHAVNMNMLTTGVDNPMLDIVADAQPTMSTGKHVQKYGRATRPFAGKLNGLILDFAGNISRLGPINDPLIPRRKGEGSAGDAPVRICPSCGVYNHASVRTCINCGLQFDFSPILNSTASTAEVLRSDQPIVEEYDVTRVIYQPHVSKTGNKSVKLVYYCGMKTFFDYKSVEGKGFKQGRDWFRQVYGEPFDGMKNSDVLNMISYLRPPRRVKVWTNKKPYPQVLGQEF